ncbi:hypothetical protein COEREDRAFT_50518 [Coemansia reversa NRRL 1564]|uniref:pyridoxal 5'-phosphate synthase (glutamine hydrolyzing) n=1 Tax=Coemansia reversa (strain ATCC 12441 / NRRL 1564) TaxID=763665 RepID=A0A2G5B1J6_COERN|nr:hypothetical protein COEREDRAFT_50518 [Coemansia reversa NRRL 1564]|eukprot:PIA12882.1 hypothetical protein COEREDRAFT_50518 [Coemansia reversa NRRL 1564]
MSRTDSIQERSKRYAIKIELAKMLVGKMIVVVRSPSDAYIAEEFGAGAVVPTKMAYAELRQIHGGMYGPELDVILDVMDRVTIPVIGRVRTGHTSEAMALEAALVNLIEENEFILQAQTEEHISKHSFKIPFIGEAANLKEALQRIAEGVSLIRTSYTNDDETYDVSQTFSAVRKIFEEIDTVANANETLWINFATSNKVSIELVKMVARLKKLPVPFFAAGGISMPVDVAMLMSLGCDGVFISSRVFFTVNPEARLRAIRDAIEGFDDPSVAVTLMDEVEGFGKQYYE